MLFYNRVFNKELESMPQCGPEGIYFGWNGSAFDSSAFSEKFAQGRVTRRQVSQMMNMVEACSLFRRTNSKSFRYVVCGLLLMLVVAYAAGLVFRLKIPPIAFIMCLVMVPPTICAHLAYLYCRNARRSRQLKAKMREIQNVVFVKGGVSLQMSEHCAYISLVFAPPQGNLATRAPESVQLADTAKPAVKSEAILVNHSSKFNNRFMTKSSSFDAQTDLQSDQSKQTASWNEKHAEKS